MRSSREIFEEGKHLMVEGKFGESVREFTKAIDAGEKSEVVFLSRGVAYLRDHKADEAIRDFDEVVKTNDGNVRAHYYRGVAYMTKDGFKSAISDFDRTIELDPENGSAFFARGTAYSMIGNEELATKNIKTAISLSEANTYGLQETIGLLRTQFDNITSIMRGDRKPSGMTLNEHETKVLKGWLEEGYNVERDH